MSNNKKPEILKEICSSYGFKNVVMLKRIRGLGTSNFIIEADSVLFLLKVYEHTNQDNIKRVEDITLFLHSRGLPVVLPIKNKHGLLHASLNNTIFALYPKVMGNIPNILTLRSLQSIVSIIALFHKSGQFCNLKLTNTKDIIFSIEQINVKASAILRLAKKESLSLEADSLIKELVKTKLDILSLYRWNDILINHKYSKSLVHGDFHIENMIFNNKAEVAYIFDFETVHFGDGIEDIIHFIIYRFINSNYNPENFKEARLFLTLYSHYEPLTAEEIKVGIYCSLYMSIGSFFLEEKILKTKDLNLVKHLKWSLRRLLYFGANIDNFINQICNEITLGPMN